MKAFIEKYEDRIHGVVSCFDRMLFRGYLPIMSGWQMAQFFNRSGIRFRELKAFLVDHAERVKRHAVELAQHQKRPFHFCGWRISRELRSCSDHSCSLDWPRLLNRYAKKINPLMADLLKNMPYYWVTAQSEYTTDILFKSAAALNELYPRLLSHCTLCFGLRKS